MGRNPFGRREPTPELSSALAALDRLAAARPELKSPARSLSRVLAAAFAAPPAGTSRDDFSSGSSRVDAVRRAWMAGETAFRAVPPEFDASDLRARALAILKALRRDNPDAAALAKAEFDWVASARLAVRGDERGIARCAADLRVNPELVASVLRLALLPVLALHSAELAPHRPESSAGGGPCPNCGRPPILGESRGLEGRRRLRCGLCAADWAGPRLACAACGEDDPRSVRSLFVEGEEARLRLVRCDSCGSALKVISTLSPLSVTGLIVAELATVHLDLIS